MKFSDIVDQASALLQRKGRVTYRVLKREFALDEEQLEDLKEDLLFSHPEIKEADGRGLVWTGDSNATLAPGSPSPQPPSTYTPQHLAERIRAEQHAMESRGATDGERKAITALFADLKGSPHNNGQVTSRVLRRLAEHHVFDVQCVQVFPNRLDLLIL